jgi:hypothetical protein
MKPRPPLVVLAYLWNTPFTLNNGTVPSLFHYHQRVAAEYDFVVGHVNLASYIEELSYGGQLSKKFFLADQHHPSRMGHAVLAHLLLDLVVDEKRQVTGLRNTTQKTPFQWACGTESAEKRLIQKRVEGNPPLASYTLEYPRNEKVYPGMLIFDEGVFDTITLGKEDPKRKDRQLALAVPCCRDNRTFDFVVPHNKTIAMQAIQLGEPKNKINGKLRVFLDSQDVSTTPIGTARWDCLWNFKDIYQNLTWISLENERNVSRIRFCNPMCNESRLIHSLVIY